MRKRGIIWDFDGVQVDTFRPHFFIEFATARGFPPHSETEWLLADNWGLHAVELFEVCFGVTREEAEHLNNGLEDHDHHDPLTFFDGVCETIAQLADEGYPQTVVSSRGHSSIITSLAREGILDCFARICAKENTPFMKPDPRAFEQSLAMFRSFGLRKQDAVFIGDTFVDREAGINASITTVLVETGPWAIAHREKYPHPPHLVIPSATHLPTWLEQATEHVPAA